MIGNIVLKLLAPFLEFIAPIIPGEIFPYFFTMEMFQRSLIAALLVTMVAGFLGLFLLMRNLALIGDGLAHVSFGGVAIAIVFGSTTPLWYALTLSIISAILIHEMQAREILSGDASIGIFLTGMLALGLVVLRIWGGGIQNDIEGYLFGNLLLVDKESFELICIISIISLIFLTFSQKVLLVTTIDPLAAQVQGIPVRATGLVFSVITASIVVSMVQVMGALLVTALLITPSATAQLVGNSFRSCFIWAQIFGFTSVILGLYFSAEEETGSGSMIALIAAIIFGCVAIFQRGLKPIFQPADN
jgi:zinc transport system permease protein|tara:strand:- start:288 stop:1196 length:909 start_codon:yes stop_codon:yes gene_type:complete